MGYYDLSAETLDAIATAGFDVYQSHKSQWRTYAFFTDGVRIGYIQNDSAGHLCMENDEQRDTRLASDPDINPDWKPRVAYRVYACETCGAETNISTNHTGKCVSRCKGACRTVLTLTQRGKRFSGRYRACFQ